ncbi:MAG TPA: DUF2911 domain-containing protein [Gemmatimonadales bacterium]|nr:DUF2911 domain-containing protein [Gemmatimonadales bacterium]
MNATRIAALVAAIALLGTPATLAAQTGQFVVRLGHDTLAIEQYTRTADRLLGELVVRAPRTVHQLYTATFGPGGTVEDFELVTHNVSGASGPAETKVTTRTLPYVGQSYALVEEVTRAARAAGGARYTTSMLPPGDTVPLPVTVEARGSDSLVLNIGGIGPLRARVDQAGTILGVSGIGGTSQVIVERVRGLDFAALGKSFAPRSLGRLSPPDTVRANVAGASLTVRYSRPSTRGRVIFGNVVPWNQVWRTGANEATVFETSIDLLMDGSVVPAGKYSLWTIPSPAGWKLILNKNTGQWGTAYDAKYDLARLDMSIEALQQPVERFTIVIESKGAGGVLKLEWEKTSAWIPFEVR